MFKTFVVFTTTLSMLASSMVVINGDDLASNSEVDVNANNSFEISFRGNPTTGYSWILAESKSSIEHAVDSVGEPEYTPAHQGSIGGGGTFVFRFRAGGEGTANMIFQYKRPWESEPVSEKTVRVLIS